MDKRKSLCQGRVHHTHKGYNLQGRLIYDALMDALREQPRN